MADQLVVQISRKWGIAEDHLQWILQRSRGKRGWRGHSFCRTRKALIRCIGEHVRPEADEDPALVDAAIARVQRWPEWHQSKPKPLAGVAVEISASTQQHERTGRDAA